MNLHLNRRLEVLAREIAEAKKPRINASESIAFDLAARSPQYKTLGDLKNKGAVKPLPRTDFTRDADTLPSTPSTEPGVKFKVGQQVKIINGSFAGLVGKLSFFHSSEIPMCHVYVDGKKHVTLLAWVEPAPSPDAETVGDGWVKWNGAFSPPPSIPVGTKYMLNWRGKGIEGRVRTMHDPADCDWTDCIAYKVLAGATSKAHPVVAHYGMPLPSAPTKAEGST